MLTVEDINVYYGAIHAIKGISLDVPDGEIVALIGSNGAGKSTTLRTISGLMKPKTGKILYEGHDIAGVPAHKIVGMGLCQVPEGRHVFADLAQSAQRDNPQLRQMRLLLSVVSFCFFIFQKPFMSFSGFQNPNISEG